MESFMPDDEVDEYVLHFELEGFENVGQLMRISEHELQSMMKVAHLRTGHKRLILAAWRVLNGQPAVPESSRASPNVRRKIPSNDGGQVGEMRKSMSSLKKDALLGSVSVEKRRSSAATSSVAAARAAAATSSDEFMPT